MRKIVLLLLIPFLCANTYGNNTADQTQALAVSVVLDISPPMKKHASSTTAIERQVFTSLKRGDYIELISAHHKTSRLRLAQFIKSADTEEVKTLSTIAGNIKYADWLDSDVAAAFDMAYRRFDQISKKQRFGKYIILILTDGNLKNSEASRIRHIAGKCNERNWLAYVTGTHYTNRHILTAAAGKDDLHWSLISDACPAVWLSEIRKSLAVKEDKTPIRKPPPKQLLPVRPPTPSSSQQKPSPKTETILAKTATVKADPPPKPKAQPKRPAVKLALKPSAIKPIQPARRLWPWLVLLLILVAIIVGAILSKNFKEYKILQEKLRARLAKIRRHKNNKMLNASYNGRTFRLGTLARLRAVHIGSGPHNSIKITDDSITDRHLKIYRKRRNLMVRNLARTSIFVRHSEVKPGHEHPLVLPTVLQLSEKVKLELSVNRKETRIGTVTQEV